MLMSYLLRTAQDVVIKNKNNKNTFSKCGFQEAVTDRRVSLMRKSFHVAVHVSVRTQTSLK